MHHVTEEFVYERESRSRVAVNTCSLTMTKCIFKNRCACKQQKKDEWGKEKDRRR